MFYHLLIVRLRLIIQRICAVPFIQRCFSHVKRSFLFKFVQRWHRKSLAYIDRLLASPKAKVEFVEQWATALTQIVGVRVLERNYKPYWLSYWPGVVVVEFYFLTIYSVYYFVVIGQPIRSVAALSLLAVAIPVS